MGILDVPYVRGPYVSGAVKLTSGATRPSSPSVGDIHVMVGPNYNPVTQLPWEAVYWADQLALAADAKVASFTDLSVNGRHATQATSGNQPFFRQKVAKMGDRAVVEFVAASTTYLTTTQWTVGTAQPNTIVAVGRIADVSQCLWDTANTSFVQRLSRGSNGDWNFKSSTATTLAATGDSRPHCFVGVYNGVSSSLRIDGVTVVSGDSGNNSLRGLTLGARNDLGVPTSGYLAFLGVITDTLTADQLAAFEWWARNYYNLAWAGI
jgi:hypothetical protein